MRIKIIQADVSQAAIIATIGKKSFRSAFEPLFNSKVELFDYLEKTYDPIKLVKSLRKGNNVYFLAWLDGRPVGFAKIKKSSLNDHIESIAQMELQKIYVLQEYHGFGIGKALMEEIKCFSKQIFPDYLWLDVHTSNEKAIYFYEKNGFIKMSKSYFTIGSQTFHYYVMGFPVVANIKTAC